MDLQDPKEHLEIQESHVKTVRKESKEQAGTKVRLDFQEKMVLMERGVPKETQVNLVLLEMMAELEEQDLQGRLVLLGPW